MDRYSTTHQTAAALGVGRVDRGAASRGDGDIIVPLGAETGPLSLERRLPRVTASGWPIRDWSAPHGRDATCTACSRWRRTSRER